MYMYRSRRRHRRQNLSQDRTTVRSRQEHEFLPTTNDHHVSFLLTAGLDGRSSSARLVRPINRPKSFEQLRADSSVAHGGRAQGLSQAGVEKPNRQKTRCATRRQLQLTGAATCSARVTSSATAPLKPAALCTPYAVRLMDAGTSSFRGCVSHHADDTFRPISARCYSDRKTVEAVRIYVINGNARTYLEPLTHNAATSNRTTNFPTATTCAYASMLTESSQRGSSPHRQLCPPHRGGLRH